MNDDEQFYAWLDGELEGTEADRVAARVAADPALAELARRHRSLSDGLSGAFAPVMDDARSPPKFGSAQPIDLGARRVARDARRGSFGLPQWAAMAATLAIGIVAGQFVGDRSSLPVENRDGSMIAAASLDRALDSRIASAGSDGSVRIGLTFRDRTGGICRSFSDETSTGLACRHGRDWQIESLFARPEGQRGDYRMAAGEDPRLAAMIDDRIAGEPFDAAAERAARERDWR